MPTFHVINLGCRANQADGAGIERDLSQRDFQQANDALCADVVVLNSCTVTSAADSDLRQTVRRIHRENPAAQIVVTGCYAQRAPQELAVLPGVASVIGNGEKPAIASLLAKNCNLPQPIGDGQRSFAAAVDFHSFVTVGPFGSLVPSGPESTSHLPRILVGDIGRAKEFPSSPSIGGPNGDRTRPNLKIQDGCNNRCSFCIIPQVRGRSRSLAPAEALRQIRGLCAAGYREVVLSGINLGRYGRDLNNRMRFPELVRIILCETTLERLRLSSVEPMDFTDELLDLMAASPRIAKHVHAPLQSGSDRILRRMYRKYHPWNYRERLLAAHARMPNAAFGADVMVGFPGETEEDFEETFQFIESLPFTYLHVFPFSRRPGTPADTMPDQVFPALIRERSRRLRELAARKNLEFRERQIGRSLSIVTLEDRTEEGTLALSDNYLKVTLPGIFLAGNQLLEARVTSLRSQGLAGELIEAQSAVPSAESVPSTITCASA